MRLCPEINAIVIAAPLGINHSEEVTTVGDVYCRYNNFTIV